MDNLMANPLVYWDAEDDPRGNIQHIAIHGITQDEVEEVLEGHYEEYVISRETGNPIAFGETSTGKYLGVVFDVVEPELPSVYPLTAFEVPTPAVPKKGKRKR
jgi:hypothetical protein